VTVIGCAVFVDNLTILNTQNSIKLHTAFEISQLENQLRELLSHLLNDGYRGRPCSGELVEEIAILFIEIFYHQAGVTEIPFGPPIVTTPLITATIVAIRTFDAPRFIIVLP
jgi:hypothetical protein